MENIVLIVLTKNLNAKAILTYEDQNYYQNLLIKTSFKKNTILYASHYKSNSTHYFKQKINASWSDKA